MSWQFTVVLCVFIVVFGWMATASMKYSSRKKEDK